MNRPIFAAFLLLATVLATASCKSNREAQTQTVRATYQAVLGPCNNGGANCLVLTDATGKTTTVPRTMLSGFVPEPGLVYELELDAKTINNSDAAYELVRIINTQKATAELKSDDIQTMFHDIFGLIAIDGKEIDYSQPFRNAVLELNPTEGKYQGNAGCNRFFGTFQIDSAGNWEVSAPGATRKLCPDMEVEQALLSKLPQANKAVRKGLELVLLQDDTELLRFRKMD